MHTQKHKHIYILIYTRIQCNFKKWPNQIYFFLKVVKRKSLKTLVPARSTFLQLKIEAYNENADTTLTIEVLAGSAIINNVGNILHFKAITCSAILRISGPGRVGIRCP